MKRIVTLALAVVLLVTCFPVAVSADENTSLGMELIGSEGYQTMTSSDDLVDIIKTVEGFSETPYWDYGQYTVGFGCNANQEEGFIESITVEEAEVLLRRELKENYEAQVNLYCQRIGRQPNQHQFDALVSFTYNCGSGWMGTVSTVASRIDAWLRNPTTEMEFVSAIGSWKRAGGEILIGLVQRRIREAILFLKGEYSIRSTPDPKWNVSSELAVISDYALPYYCSVVFELNGGTVDAAYSDGQDKDDFVVYYKKGGTYSPLPTPTREGYTFAGWMVTRVNSNRPNSGQIVTSDTAVQSNLELTAQWTENMEDNGDSGDSGSDTVTLPSTGDSDPGVFIPAAGQPFVDVPTTAWYLDSLIYVYDNGYMNGIDEKTFSPETSLTRAMLVTVLYRMDGSPDVNGYENSFVDVKENGYYYDAVIWAQHNGIVNGITADQFAPEADLTRQQAVAIFYRYCVEYKGTDGSVLAELDAFPDQDQVQPYALTPMQWAVANRVLTGVAAINGDTVLDVNGSLRRSQCAALIQRCCTEILGMGE